MCMASIFCASSAALWRKSAGRSQVRLASGTNPLQSQMKTVMHQQLPTPGSLRVQLFSTAYSAYTSGPWKPPRFVRRLKQDRSITIDFSDEETGRRQQCLVQPNQNAVVGLPCVCTYFEVVVPAVRASLAVAQASWLDTAQALALNGGGKFLQRVCK